MGASPSRALGCFGWGADAHRARCLARALQEGVSHEGLAAAVEALQELSERRQDAVLRALRSAAPNHLHALLFFVHPALLLRLQGTDGGRPVIRHLLMRVEELPSEWRRFVGRHRAELSDAFSRHGDLDAALLEVLK